MKAENAFNALEFVEERDSKRQRMHTLLPFKTLITEYQLLEGIPIEWAEYSKR